MKAATPANMTTDTDPTRINASTVVVTDSKGATIKGDILYNGNTVTFVPDASLTPAGAQYTITVKSTVQDLAGNPVGQDYLSSFTTPDNISKKVVRDGSGNLYFIGSTVGGLLNLANKGGKDLFVTKVSSAGSVLWTTLIGGTADEDAAGIALDASGNIYVAGTTNGTIQTTPLSSTANLGGTDIFVAKLEPALGGVQWVQQMGTATDQTASDIAVGNSGTVGNEAVYVTGYTHDEVSTNSGADALLIKVDLNGKSLLYKPFGTDANERGQAATVDSAGNAYMAGYAQSAMPGLPTGESYQGAGDIFLTMFNASGTPIWTHETGTTDNDVATGIALDSSGNIYLAGQTNGQLAGNVNASGISGGTHDVFVMKYAASGDFQWAKQTGSAASEMVSGIAVDSTGVYVSGCTYGALPGISTNAGRSDLFLIRFSADPVSSGGSIALNYQQLGTAADELTGGLALDGNGISYLTGSTSGALSGSGLTGLLGSILQGSLTNQLFQAKLP